MGTNQFSDGDTAVIAEILRRKGIETAPARPDDLEDAASYDQIAATGGFDQIERAMKRYGSQALRGRKQ